MADAAYSEGPGLALHPPLAPRSTLGNSTRPFVYAETSLNSTVSLSTHCNTQSNALLTFFTTKSLDVSFKWFVLKVYNKEFSTTQI